MIDSPQPLTLVKKLEKHLSHQGYCQQVYATAEYQPFSSAFKPDLVFIPQTGPRTSQTLFLDFTKNFGKHLQVPLLDILSERRSFVEEYVERPIDWYLIFANLTIDSFTSSGLQKKKLLVMKYSNDPEEVLAEIKMKEMI